jgi:hypothetical protein
MEKGRGVAVKAAPFFLRVGIYKRNAYEFWSAWKLSAKTRSLLLEQASIEVFLRSGKEAIDAEVACEKR